MLICCCLYWIIKTLKLKNLCDHLTTVTCAATSSDVRKQIDDYNLIISQNYEDKARVGGKQEVCLELMLDSLCFIHPGDWQES